MNRPGLTAAASLPAALAPVVLLGLGFVAQAGWVFGLLAVAALGALLRRQNSARPQSRAPPEDPGAAVGLCLLALGALAAAIVVAALILAMGSILVIHPAAIWTLPVLLLVALARGQRRRASLALLVVAVPLAGWLGVSFERAGADARGWAHSGPLAGVHPFQTTAVVVDGYGPFDIPINDYVEPDDSRGYGPEALAENYERHLHAIAETHFDEGPARAYAAFAGATAEVREVPQLYDAETNPLSIGIVVESGTHGDRSRVEFVCPGKLVDPRPRPAESLMRRACPTKYANEASAGLGLTGRWPGYVEARGVARAGFASWLGWTRSGDDEGRRVLRRERTMWAVFLLVALTIATRRKQVSENLGALSGGVTGLLLFTGFAALVGFISAPQVSAWPDGSAPLAGSAVVALAALAGFWRFGSDGDDSSGAPGEDGTSAWAVGAIVAVLAMAGAWAMASPRAAQWLADSPAPHILIERMANALWGRLDVDVLRVEGLLAAGLFVSLAGAVLAILGSFMNGVARLGLGQTKGSWALPITVGLLAWLFAVTGVLDRTVMVVAVGGAAVVSSAAAVLARRGARQRARLDLVLHFGFVALALTIAVETLLRRPPTMGPMLVLLVGALLMLGSLLVAKAGREPPEEQGR